MASIPMAIVSSSAARPSSEILVGSADERMVPAKRRYRAVLRRSSVGVFAVALSYMGRGALRSSRGGNVFRGPSLDARRIRFLAHVLVGPREVEESRACVLA